MAAIFAAVRALPGTAEAADPAPAAKATPWRWAIVASEELRESGISALLTARMARFEGVQLVEREEIQRVLDELSLNAAGLVEPAAAMKFGRLSGAEAFVVLQFLTARPKDGKHRDVRVLILETATGVRLFDETVPHEGPENSGPESSIEKRLAALDQRLRDADAKLRQPRLARRYVALLDLYNEEPGRALDDAAAATRVRVEQDLVADPDVYLLDRSHLEWLNRERELTVEKRGLRSAALLATVGLRRAGSDLAVTLRLVRLRGEPDIVTFSVPAADATATRQAIARRIASAVRNAPEAKTRAIAREEARHLMEHAKSCFAQRRYEPATRLGEAALAISFSSERREETARFYQALMDSRDEPLLVRLGASRRLQEFGHEFFRERLAENAQHLASPANYSLSTSVPLGDQPTAEERRLSAEAKRLALASREIVLAHAKRKGRTLAPLLVGRLQRAAEFAESPQALHKEVAALVTELDAETRAGRFERKESEPSWSNYWHALEGLPAEVQTWHRQWPKEAALSTFQWLAGRDEPVTAFFGNLHIVRLKLDGSREAAWRMVHLAPQLPRPKSDAGRFPPVSVRDALEPFERAGLLGPFVDARLREAEASTNTTLLVQLYGDFVRAALRSGPDDERRDRGRRVLALFETAVVDPAHESEAARLRGEAKYAINNGGRPRWPQRDPTTYLTVRRLELGERSLETHAHLDCVEVDEGPDGRHRERPILLAWRSWRPGQAHKPGASQPSAHDYVLTRLSASGGALHEVGRASGASGGVFRILDTAEGFFLLSKTQVVWVSGGKSRTIDAQAGLPTDQIHDGAWLDGRLYLASAVGLVEFDPKASRFRAFFASGAEIDADRRPAVRYGVTSLLSDTSRRCLWLAMEGRAAGIWKFTPRVSKLQRVSGEAIGPLAWADGKVLCQSAQPELDALGRPGLPTGKLLDPVTQRITVLRGLHQAQTKPASVISSTLKGDHFIQAPDRLWVQAGSSWARHDLQGFTPWRTVRLLGNGVLVASHGGHEVAPPDTKGNSFEARLWYLEPKRASKQ